MLHVSLCINGRVLFTLAATCFRKSVRCKVQAQAEKMALQLYSTSHCEFQHFLLVWDIRLTLSSFAPAHMETGFCLSVVWADWGHYWHFWGSDSAQVQTEGQVWACSYQRLRNFMAKQLKLHLPKCWNQLCFILLVCKLLCYCSNISHFYFSSQDSKHLFSDKARHTLTFKWYTTDFESFSIRSE